MKTNEGLSDRLIRIIAGGALAALPYFFTLPAWVGTVLMTVAGILVLTGLIGFCPLYALFGLTTRKTRAHSSHTSTPGGHSR